MGWAWFIWLLGVAAIVVSCFWDEYWQLLLGLGVTLTLIAAIIGARVVALVKKRLN